MIGWTEFQETVCPWTAYSSTFCSIKRTFLQWLWREGGAGCLFNLLVFSEWYHFKFARIPIESNYYVPEKFQHLTNESTKIKPNTIRLILEISPTYLISFYITGWFLASNCETDGRIDIQTYKHENLIARYSEPIFSNVSTIKMLYSALIFLNIKMVCKYVIVKVEKVKEFFKD